MFPAFGTVPTFPAVVSFTSEYPLIAYTDFKRTMLYKPARTEKEIQTSMCIDKCNVFTTAFHFIWTFVFQSIIMNSQMLTDSLHSVKIIYTSGSQSGVSGSAAESVRDTDSWARFQTYWIRDSGNGPSDVCFNISKCSDALSGRKTPDVHCI